MKPSKRIKELESKITNEDVGEEIAPYWLGSSLLTALVLYLDEQYEMEETTRKELKEKLEKQATCPLDCDCRLKTN